MVIIKKQRKKLWHMRHSFSNYAQLLPIGNEK